MTALTGRPTGVVCDDRDDTRAAVEALLIRRGYQIALTTPDLDLLLAALPGARPDLAVVALAACGTRGLGAVTAVRDAHDRCAVVVLSPFVGLRSAASRRGAWALVEEDDLQALEAVLAEIAASPEGQPRRRRAPSRTLSGANGSGAAVAGADTTNPSS
jgi:ActR/RegA family two-component response regulator